jgi:hypothetical protein
MKDIVKTNTMPDTILPTKQRLSVQFPANFPHYLSPSEKHLTGQNPFLEPGPATKPSLVDMKGMKGFKCSRI